MCFNFIISLFAFFISILFRTLTSFVLPFQQSIALGYVGIAITMFASVTYFMFIVDLARFGVLANLKLSSEDLNLETTNAEISNERSEK